MDHADDDDDLDERLSKVFEERGWTPRPDPAARPAAQGPGRAAAPSGPTARQAAPNAAAAPESRKAMPPSGRTGRREKTILLGLLGTLVGAFAGVLSLKLFVPRPPAGAGPDVHLATAAAAPLEVVDPPALADRRSNLPTSPDPFRVLAAAAPESLDAAPSPSAFVVGDAAPEYGAVDRHGRLEPTDGPADLLPVPADDAAATFATPPMPPGPTASGIAPRFAGVATAAELPAGPLGGHVVRAGDSWWSIAEGAYGDGRLYKALVAWNRALDPRTSLAPGTRLDVPDAARLRASWPRLVPADDR